ncbi:hypothetical protein IPM65_01225 [Candidatus Roizmanbacteria bacterium]|nr:MAG: hypothetical protein IPM65_01225 [Candidatus Roizmanbacteria bacterium]
MISNAIKYSRTKVRFQSASPKRKIRKNCHAGSRDRHVKVSTKRLFQRFYRADKVAHRFSGLGIGLYISSEIIKRHRGKIWVESDEGEGSTFYFTLPLKI